MPDTGRAARAAAEIARINAFFPVMEIMGNRMAAQRPFEGHTIGVSAHLTTLTGTLLRNLSLGGGEWVVSATSNATTDHGVVDLLRAGGMSVYTTGGRQNEHAKVLEHVPTILADVGGDLIHHLVTQRQEQAAELHGAVEVTKSGITRLQDITLPFGVVNINDGRLKPAIENRHGVGEGLWHAVQGLTGMHLSGRKIGVIGYGPVGRGVAAYARATGAQVTVVESDPIRRLVAHYDGFPTPPMAEVISTVGLLVTCTGHPRVITADMLRDAQPGLVLINAGHGGDELDVMGIRAAATRIDQISDHVVRYDLDGNRGVVLLGNGHPLNIVMNAGSPEPVLLHFTLLALTLAWLCRNTPSKGQLPIPPGLEDEAARMALSALGMSHG
jgi:adenosylhomocysteinase